MIKKLFRNILKGLGSVSNETNTISGNIISNNVVSNNVVVGGSIVVNSKNGKITYQGVNSTMVTDSGNVKEVNLDIVKFSKVKIDGCLKVNMVIAEKTSACLKADENIIDLIEVKVSNDTLIVGIKNGVSFRTSSPLILNVSNPVLVDIELNGSGKFQVSNLNVDKMSSKLKGSGDIILAGSVNTLDLYLTGSGDIDAEETIAQNVYANLKGSGDITATAISNANVVLSGSGDVKIYGKTANKQQSLSGSGDIKFK